MRETFSAKIQFKIPAYENKKKVSVNFYLYKNADFRC